MDDRDIRDEVDEIRRRRRGPAEKREKEERTNSEADVGQVDIETEMAEIRRRRAELAREREAETAEEPAPEAPEAAEELAPETEEPRIYVVKPGDSLSKISKDVYGNAGRWREIFEANKDQIKDPNLIRPGWKLRIP